MDWCGMGFCDLRPLFEAAAIAFIVSVLIVAVSR